MKSKFALSFGIALIAIGSVNFFLETNNIILFGISVSAFVFSLFSILFATKVNGEKYEFLYIIPLLIMLCFFCYGDELLNFDTMNYILDSKLTSALTFVSFGLSFVSEYITNYNLELSEKLRHISLSKETVDYNCLLLSELIKYRRELLEKKIITDDVSENFVNRLEVLLDEQNRKIKIKNRLLQTKNNKYTLDDFDKIYTEETNKLAVDSIMEEINENIAEK